MYPVTQYWNDSMRRRIHLQLVLCCCKIWSITLRQHTNFKYLKRKRSGKCPASRKMAEYYTTRSSQNYTGHLMVSGSWKIGVTMAGHVGREMDMVQRRYTKCRNGRNCSEHVHWTGCKMRWMIHESRKWRGGAKRQIINENKRLP